MVYANMVGYLVAGASGLVLGTLLGSKVTSALMSMMHGLEARVVGIESALSVRKISAAGTASHAAAIEVHAAAVTQLANAIGKHAAAIDEHGAATVAAAVEAHAGTIAAAVEAHAATIAGSK